MAAINFSALNGQGYLYSFDLPILEHTWVITTPTSYGSAYLTFEAVRLPNGFYDDTSSTPGLATFSDFVGLNIDTLVTSSNKFSVVIPQGGGTFKWVNTNIIPANTMFIRGTGGITITSSSTSYIFTSKAELQTAVNLWISDNTAALATYGEINTWNVSAVTDMASLFSIKTTFNSDISNWDVSNVTDMNNMFRGAVSFDQPLNAWDVSNVTAMNSMFSSANSFNQPIGGWTLSSLTDMNNMFRLATSFDQPLNAWDVSSVTNMSSMFSGADIFNQPIGDWDVSNVTIMASMFEEATTFDQPLNDWDVSNVTNMAQMFSNADAFQQPLNLWTPNSLSGVFGGSGFMGVTGEASAITYNLLDTLLNGWVVDFAALQSNVTISFGDSTFTAAGLAARNILVNDKGWTITDGGQV